MLKLELKRIFSKKINVFAIGLALILAVIFSGFAVTSNRYVDENGNASTGIMATRKLTDNRRAWKGTLTEDELGKVIEQNKNADSDLGVSTASPGIEKLMDEYKIELEKMVENTPEYKAKAFVFYDFRFIKNFNVDINAGQTRESVKYPDSFVSTMLSVAENKLYLYETLDCKFEEAAEDEITFSINRFSSKSLRTIFSFLDNGDVNVVVPSADYSSFVLVSTKDQQWIQLN